MVRWKLAAFERELTIGGIPIVCIIMEGRVRMSSSTFGGFCLKDLSCGSSCAMDAFGSMLLPEKGNHFPWNVLGVLLSFGSCCWLRCSKFFPYARTLLTSQQLTY